MAKAKRAAPAPAAPANKRGSPEAIQKRRVARRLNDILGGKTPASARGRDGRTEKRRQRLLAELGEGTKKGVDGLKAIDLLRRVNDLLELGEPIGSIRKVARVRRNRAVTPEAAVQILREVHAAYSFRPEAYRFLGMPHDALVQAKLIEPGAPRRGRPPKHGRTAAGKHDGPPAREPARTPREPRAAGAPAKPQ